MIHRLKNSRSGFTLIEINLVLLIIGIAVTSLMGLFPVGLREASLASDDTSQAMFAERVLNAIQAKAAAISDLGIWKNRQSFISEIEEQLLDNAPEIEIAATPGGVNDHGQLISNYLGMDRNFIRYKIVIQELIVPQNSGANLTKVPRMGAAQPHCTPIYRVTLWVTTRKNGNPYNNTPYTSYLKYLGAQN